MKICVTGGAGFIGTSLVPMLLAKGHQVTVLDRLFFGIKAILPMFRHDGFSFVKGDIRDKAAIESAAQGCDAIVHLAAIVGYPACEKNQQLAQETNVMGTENVIVAASGRPIVFASTGSCYGVVEGDLCTEETPLHPLSLYAQTKAQAEEMLLSQGNAVAYRIATAFGISPRLRLDLLVNEFVHRALHERKLEVYQGDASRSFIHVCDIARAFCLAVENPNPMLGQVFNLGSESLNFTKMEICQMIQRRLPLVQIVASETGFDPDQRNYAVSYAKLRGLGYQTTISLDEGINELAAALQHIADRASYSNARAV